jgi:ADP-ribose pyrophosphatase
MKVHASHRVYQGRVVNLRVDEIDAYSGDRTRKVEVVEHVGGVAIVAMPTPTTIVLVKQYRHPVAAELWEVPAGMIESGEPPLETAKRELIEETGYRAERWRALWSIFTTPGFCNERIHFFVAEGLSEGAAAPEDDERFELRVWDVEAAWQLVERDEVRDAKTQIALAWARSQAC